MKGMVFAAGLGTRLRPLTDSMPKALVPVGGVPMLERVILKLRDAGIGPVVVNAHHFAGKVEQFVRSRDFGVDVSLSIEDGAEPLETGGGIRHAEHLLRGGRFLVHNVDILSDADLRAFMRADDPSDLATRMLTDRPADRKLLFDGEMRLVGWTNTRTGEVKSPYPGRDPEAFRALSFCGIHILSGNVFSLMQDWPEKFGIIDFYLRACKDHPVRGIVADNLRLIDIGTPETLAEAQRATWAF